MIGSLVATSVTVGGWKLSNFTAIDLIAASTNALNGALLARRPDHYKNFTIVGILGMALIGGLGGGIIRDILIGKTPSALLDPAYITLCFIFGIVGYLLAYKEGELFREGVFQFMTAFSLPWYAIIGAKAGVDAKVPILGCLVLAVVGPTAGRWLIDVSCGVTPKQFIRSEWFVSIALLTGLIWILLTSAGLSTWPATILSFLVGFVVRLLALYRGWEEPLASEPKGAYLHSEGRPHLGRKLSGKSQRELRDLGLTVEQSRSDAVTGSR
jgi:uncharacterized membrane protein YeiH